MGRKVSSHPLEGVFLHTHCLDFLGISIFAFHPGSPCRVANVHERPSFNIFSSLSPYCLLPYYPFRIRRPPSPCSRYTHYIATNYHPLLSWDIRLILHLSSHSLTLDFVEYINQQPSSARGAARGIGHIKFWALGRQIIVQQRDQSSMTPPLLTGHTIHPPYCHGYYTLSYLVQR